VDASPTPAGPAEGVATPPGAPLETPPGRAAPTLARALGPFDITMLVMGSVIGVGIFAVPQAVASIVWDPTLVLAAWAVGGLVTLAGTLVYAELARRRPQVGGQYAFLREAYHPAVAFVYGWSLLLVIQSGSIASVAVIFANYASELLHLLADWLAASGLGPLGDLARTFADVPAALSVLAIAAFTAVNCAGVRSGGTTQDVFMVLKIAVIAALVVCGLFLAGGGNPVLGGPGAPAGGPPAVAGLGALSAFAAALVPVFFSYGGSHTTTFVAGEVRDPGRNLPRGLVVGVCGVIALYLAVNYACLRVLGVEQLGATKTPATDVMRRALGAPGALFISVGVVLSALGWLSQATLTSPRVYYAMARDGLFFRSVAWVDPRTRAPAVAILLQGGVAAVIAVSGTFAQIVNYVMGMEMTFLALTSLSLFTFRRRDAAAGANLTMPGHPVTTVLFAAVMLAVVGNLLAREPANTLIGFGIALAGLPVYFFWSRRGRPAD
jgi:APA family basic amino acid/polyamine antiporter